MSGKKVIEENVFGLLNDGEQIDIIDYNYERKEFFLSGDFVKLIRKEIDKYAEEKANKDIINKIKHCMF